MALGTVGHRLHPPRGQAGPLVSARSLTRTVLSVMGALPVPIPRPRPLTLARDVSVVIDVCAVEHAYTLPLDFSAVTDTLRGVQTLALSQLSVPLPLAFCQSCHFVIAEARDPYVSCAPSHSRASSLYTLS